LAEPEKVNIAMNTGKVLLKFVRQSKVSKAASYVERRSVGSRLPGNEEALGRICRRSAHPEEIEELQCRIALH
jgi:hypothetical protein